MASPLAGKGKVLTSDARESSVLFVVPGKKDGGEQGFTGEQKQSRVNREAEETQKCRGRRSQTLRFAFLNWYCQNIPLFRNCRPDS